MKTFKGLQSPDIELARLAITSCFILAWQSLFSDCSDWLIVKVLAVTAPLQPCDYDLGT